MQIQRVDHESRVHIDIETDDIPAEVARLEKLGAKVDERKERWVITRAPCCQTRIAEVALMNGWRFHTDEVHLNSIGGMIVADLVQDFIDS